MRRFVLAVLALLVLAAPTHAELRLVVPTIVLPESSSARALSFEVWLEETDGTQAGIQGYNVGIRQSPGGVITFTGVGITIAHPAMGSNPANRTANAVEYTAGTDIWVTEDFPAEVAVDNATKNGLFTVTYQVPANTPAGTVINLNLDLPITHVRTRLFDGNAATVPFTADHGSITIVPEPSTLGLALLGLPLLARRRR